MDLKEITNTQSTNQQKQVAKTDCEICNRKDIQIIDLGPHINGKQHKRNLRKREKNNKGKEKNKQQTNEQGKQKKASETVEKTQKTEESDIQKKDSLDSIRPKYNAYGTSNRQNYVVPLAANLSLLLALDKNVQNFLIAVNDKDWRAFGDVVIKIEKKQRTIIYAIKCKRISTKYEIKFNSLKHACITLENEKNCINEIKKNKKIQKDVEIAKFAIFTTMSTSSDFIKNDYIFPDGVKKKPGEEEKRNEEKKIIRFKAKSLDQSHPIDIDLTRNCNNIFTFSESEDFENINLPNILFFTNQRISEDIFKDTSIEIFSQCPKVKDDYVNYIWNWAEKRLGGNYKLSRSDIILKLGQILLHRYIINPRLIINLEETAFSAWNKVIDNVDLTVVENEPFIINKICQPFNKIIEDTFKIKILTMSRTISLKNKIDTITDPWLRAYLFEESDLKEDLHLIKIYTVMWKCGKLPLLISADDETDQTYIQNVISFMKKYGENRKFLLKSKKVRNPNKEITIFSCLEDVKELVDLKNIYIHIKDDYKLSFDTISSTDSSFLQWITPSIFFDMALGKYYIKPSTAKNDKGISNVKIILKNSIIQELYQTFYNITRNTSSSVRTDIGSQMRIAKYQNIGQLRGVNPKILY